MYLDTLKRVWMILKCAWVIWISYKCTAWSIFGSWLCLKFANTLFTHMCREFENWCNLRVLSGKFLRQNLAIRKVFAFSDSDDEDVDYILVEGLNLRQATKTPPFLAHKSVGMFLFGPSTNLSSGRYTPPCMQRKHKTRDRRCLQQLIKENEYFNCDQLPFKEKHKFSSCSIGAWEDSWG